MLFIHLNKKKELFVVTIVFLTLNPMLLYSLVIYCNTVGLMSERASGQAIKPQKPPPPSEIPGYATDTFYP
jgi:hypothetical protein